MKTIPNNSVTTILKTLVLASILANASTVLADPNNHCFDFSDFPIGVPYVIGDSFSVDHGTIDFIRFRLPDGTPVNSPVSKSSGETSGIAGTSPELRNKLINMRFTPDAPLSHVTMDYAENTGGNNVYLIDNIIVNGERVQLTKGMAAADGIVIGNNAKGQVLVTSSLVNPVTPNPAQWINGRLEFTALSGGIETITVGGHTTAIDNYCFEY